MGGLGNQLFQVATVINIAKQQNLQPVFSDIALGYRPMYWDTIVNNATLISLDTVQFDIHPEIRWMTYQKMPLFQKHTQIDGYFQCGKYFQENEDLVRHTFKLRAHDIQKVDSIFNDIRNRHPGRLVSLHVRRTDYLISNSNLSVDYYMQALKHFNADDTFIIFSDDIEWCKNTFSHLTNKIFIHEIDYIELFIIGKCDAHIMANSSFGWWGVWLGDKYKNKTVIAPTPWFSVVTDPCIYEPHWILISGFNK
jgi:hypothetical protein